MILKLITLLALASSAQSATLGLAFSEAANFTAQSVANQESLRYGVFLYVQDERLLFCNVLGCHTLAKQVEDALPTGLGGVYVTGSEGVKYCRVTGCTTLINGFNPEAYISAADKASLSRSQKYLDKSGLLYIVMPHRAGQWRCSPDSCSLVDTWPDPKQFISAFTHSQEANRPYIGSDGAQYTIGSYSEGQPTQVIRTIGEKKTIIPADSPLSCLSKQWDRESRSYNIENSCLWMK